MNENDSQEESSPASPPEVVIQPGTSIEDAKVSIRVIEGLFHAINKATFPLMVYTEAMNGMTFLKAVHDSLIKQIGPEEVAKIRAQEAMKAGAPVLGGVQ